MKVSAKKAAKKVPAKKTPKKVNKNLRELNTYPASGEYPKQKALFKLWLTLTANDFVANEATGICLTKNDVKKFRNKNAKTKTPKYYLDLEKLATQLPPLTHDDVLRAFSLLTDDTRETFKSLNKTFYDLGVDVANYPPGGDCTSVIGIINVG